MTLLRKLSLILVTVLASGCTIAPTPVTASGPTLESNSTNGGLVGRLPDGSYEITLEALARYNALIDKGYGSRFLIPLHRNDGVSAHLANGDVIIDDEHLKDFGVMAGYFRDDVKNKPK